MTLSEFNYCWPMFLAWHGTAYHKGKITKEEVESAMQYTLSNLHIPSLKTQLHLEWAIADADNSNKVELYLHQVAWDLDNCSFYS